MQSDFFNMDRSDSWRGKPTPPAILPRIARLDPSVQAPLPIAEMADLFGVTHRTLHFYEEKRLITAERLGTMRVYDANNIRRMAVIGACREVGISLSAIQELMEELSDVRSQQEADALFSRTLDNRRRELASDISSIHRQIQQIRTMTDGCIGLTPISEQQRPPVSELEHRCLALMTEGFKGAELAERLGIDTEALADMESELIRKLGVSNRFQAAAKAIILGILPH
ncbi:MerR family transcriptional regulator [Rhizobium sp. FY34]|uniref:MerR family transcriptional regulator n=1 Tax=Rhizobium sp. FY34 TaxID=2562309 RepID=UPI0010C11A7A|nr:MerR family transcriptional regulator [Rhizobium sp. FY34]